MKLGLSMLAKMKMAVTPRFFVGDASDDPSLIVPSSNALPTDEMPLPNSNLGMVIDMPETNVFADIISVISGSSNNCPSYPYSRPEFLHFSADETHLSADKTIRPVLCPKFALPVYAGYAEVINCGKSKLNEDMAVVKTLTITQNECTKKSINLSEALKNSLLDLSDLNFANNNEMQSINLNSNVKLERMSFDEDTLPLSCSFSSDDSFVVPSAKLVYFAIFDGHAGSETAIMASNFLHEHIKNKLSDVLESILYLHRKETLYKNKLLTDEKTGISFANDENCNISSDSLVIGALESAFLEMDNQIGLEKSFKRLPGGCAAIVVLFFLNKIYVANAGDCRAVLVLPHRFLQLSTDFNPLTERKRLQAVAYRNRDVISNSFSRLEYSRRLTQKDLNSKVLYRDWYMDGWSAKTVQEADIKPTLIAKSQKPRLLNTISVSRGFGDHNLMTLDDKIAIKPFISVCPEVQVFDTQSLDSLSERDVLVLASDGFWDVFTNEKLFEIVSKTLSANKAHFLNEDLATVLNNDKTTKYTLLAQELAAAARGNPVDNCRWRLASGGNASLDDITVFVVPLKYAVNICMNGTDDNKDEELLLN